VHLTGLYTLIGVYLNGVCLIGVCLIGVHPTERAPHRAYTSPGVHLMGVHFLGVVCFEAFRFFDFQFGQKSLYPTVVLGFTGASPTPCNGPSKMQTSIAPPKIDQFL
jgi:hypothetical protein